MDPPASARGCPPPVGIEPWAAILRPVWTFPSDPLTSRQARRIRWRRFDVDSLHRLATANSLRRFAAPTPDGEFAASIRRRFAPGASSGGEDDPGGAAGDEHLAVGREQPDVGIDLPAVAPARRGHDPERAGEV